MINQRSSRASNPSTLSFCRLQVDALIQSKKALESDLTRSVMEKKEMDFGLTRASDETFGLELEKSLMSVFVDTQVGEFGVEVGGLVRKRAEIKKKMEGLKREMEKVKNDGKIEIEVLKKMVIELTRDIVKDREVSSRVMCERDELKDILGVQIGEANGLREKVAEMAERERKMVDEAHKQKMEYEGTVKEKIELESAMKSLVTEMDSVENSLVDSLRINEDLKREIGEIIKEKNEIVEERNGQVMEMNELEKERSELIGTVMVMRDAEVGLQTTVSELEKSNAEAVESRERFVTEFLLLQDQKLESERKIERLLEDKYLDLKTLEVLEEELEDLKLQIERMAREKREIEGLKASRENEIVGLQKELVNVAVTLQSTFRDQEEEKNRLESEISQYKHEIGRVTNQRDDANMDFEKEKKNATELRLNVLEMKKKFEESSKEIERIKRDHGKVVEEKKELGNHFETVKGENVFLQAELNDVRARLESKCDNFKSVLMMLKNTAELVIKLKEDDMNGNGLVEDLSTNEKRLKEKEEVQPYLEAIKDAFRSKETKVEELKRELEFLKNSAVEAKKKKQFWTLISSATALFVAATVAYVARGH